MDDAERLFEWRNAPSTYQYFRTPEPTDWDGHIKWLASSIERADRQIFIAEIGGEAIGTGRLDHDGDAIELSWTLAPESRGKGYGLPLVAALVKVAGPGAVAEIHAGNIASQKIAARAGFSRSTRGGFETWTLTPQSQHRDEIEQEPRRSSH